MPSPARIPGQLWGRRVLVDLGTEDSTGVRLNANPNDHQLRVAFRIEMTRSSDPHTGTIRVWNPSPKTIGLMQAPRAAVRLFVGYDVPRLVFFGTPIRNGVRLDREGPDTILAIEAKDGGRAYADGVVSASFGGRVGLSQVLDAVAAGLGVPRGTTNIPTNTLDWPQGLVLSGTARSCLDRITAATRTHWMITDGALVIIPADGDTGDRAVRFSSRTGNLIGSPTMRVAEPAQSKGKTLRGALNGTGIKGTKGKPGGIELKGLLDASMRPGRAFVVESKDINGTFIARDVTFEGDSGYESPYYVNLTGEALPSAAATAISSGGGTGGRSRNAGA